MFICIHQHPRLISRIRYVPKMKKGYTLNLPHNVQFSRQKSSHESISLGLWYMRGEEAARENVACKPQKISSSPAPRVLKCRRDHLSRTQANRFHPKNISYFFSKEVCDLRKNFTWRWNHQGVWTKKLSDKVWLLMQKRWGENMCLLHYSKHTSVRDLLGSPTHHHSLIIMLKWACNYLPNPNCWQRSASLASGTLFGQISSDP